MPPMPVHGKFSIQGIHYEAHQGEVGLWEVQRVEWDPVGTRTWVTDRCSTRTEAELVALQRTGYGGWTQAILARLWPIREGQLLTLPEWATDLEGHPVGGVRCRAAAVPYQVHVEDARLVGIYLNAVREGQHAPETFRIGP